MSQLVLLRHGQSEWNAQNRFTGFVDVGLTELGREEARKGGRALAGTRFDRAFSSTLKRAIETTEIALAESGSNEHLREGEGWKITCHDDLRERDYGDLAGLNKAETAEKFGEEQVHIWRRSYDVAPPGGESLKDVVERVRRYYEAEIAPCLALWGPTAIACAPCWSRSAAIRPRRSPRWRSRPAFRWSSRSATASRARATVSFATKADGTHWGRFFSPMGSRSHSVLYLFLCRPNPV